MVKECVIREGDCSIQGQEYVNNISGILEPGIGRFIWIPRLRQGGKCHRSLL